jgi:hypothetical protein
MSGRPLDCVGVDPAKAEVGKHDFRPSPTEPIVHGVGQVLVVDELAAVTRERDALKAALERCVNALYRGGDFPETASFGSQTLAKLETGELRKLGA